MMNSINIPPKRFLIYMMSLGFLPVIAAWLFTASQTGAVEDVEYRLLSIEEQAFSREKKQSTNIAVQCHFRDADHFYIDKHLETINLLEVELESIKSALKNPNVPDNDQIRKRLDAISGPANRLQFTEGAVQSTPLMQEVTETLSKPVEIDIEDLKTILCRIEGVQIGSCQPPQGRPQLIILDFKIDRKTILENNQVYQLNLKLLKREFL